MLVTPDQLAHAHHAHHVVSMGATFCNVAFYVVVITAAIYFANRSIEKGKKR